MRTPDHERQAAYAAARTRDQVDVLQARYIDEDRAADHVRRFPHRPPPPPVNDQHSLLAAIGTVLGEVRTELVDRIVALEQREPVALPTSADLAAATRTGPAVHDAGIWSRERRYEPGDLVTCAGGSWVAAIASKGLRPGDGPGWRLIHKTEVSAVRKLVREELAKQKVVAR
jgi:hypothetical protein